MINLILYPPNGNVPLKQNFNMYSGKSSGVLWRLLTKSAFHLVFQNCLSEPYLVFVCVEVLAYINI